MSNWKLIEGYDTYWVSDSGEVKNSDYYGKERLFSQQMFKGYKRVCLTKDGKKKYHFVHRLVAQAFIPNPDNKPEIDHIDGNPENNSVTNLKWATREENLANVVYTRRQSDAQTGRHLSEDTKQKIREANIGKKHSEETKQKMKIAQQERRRRESL